MPHPLIFLRITALLILVASAAAIHAAQVLPAADHHAHLQSARAARLLNEGARSHSEETPQEKEKPYTAKDLISALDAAGVLRAVALSEAYLLGTPLVHVPNDAQVVDHENDWTLRQVRRYPQRLVGFCSVNPIRPYAIAAIKHCDHIGLRGRKFVVCATYISPSIYTSLAIEELRRARRQQNPRYFQ